MVQRYKFESKSQRTAPVSENYLGCFQWFKDTNLKVNHNCFSSTYVSVCVVSNGSQIQI